MKYIFSLFLLSTVSLNYGMEDSLTVRTLNLKTEALADFVISELADQDFRIDAMENQNAADRAKKNLLVAVPHAQARIQAAIQSGVQQFQAQQQESRARAALVQQLATLQQQLAAQQATHARTSAAQDALLNELQSSNTWLKWITGGTIAATGAAWLWNFIRIADLKLQVGSKKNTTSSHTCNNTGLENRVNNVEQTVINLKQQVNKIPIVEFRDKGRRHHVLYLYVNGEDHHGVIDKNY